MSVTIYHNPGCSKSRRTLELIREKGIEPKIIEYLKNPPDTSTIERLLSLLNLQPRDLMRKNEAEYKDADLDNPNISRDALIESMHRHPILIERPIVVSGDRARIGRPPEDALEII
ncbi:MAG: arsenate reductase (glutaredoxin) [Gammaproteobacteria bacterium]